MLVFVVIGRSVHAHGVGLAGDAATAWPFLAGLAAGTLASLRAGGPAGLPSGLAVTVATVALGMALRAAVGEGVAAAFVFVALAWFAATMLGWRLVAGRLFSASSRRGGRGTSRRR